MGTMSKTKQPPDLVATVDSKPDPEMLDIGTVEDKKITYEQVAVPLDGGYGWVIVMAVAVLSFTSLWYVGKLIRD